MRARGGSVLLQLACFFEKRSWCQGFLYERIVRCEFRKSDSFRVAGDGLFWTFDRNCLGFGYFDS